MRWAARGLSRREWLAAALGAGAKLTAASGERTPVLASEWRRYSDPTTELEVYRLTDPAHSSILPAYYNRAIARSGGWMIFASDRTGAPQAFHMDLKNGEMRQWTDVEGLNAASLTLTPDNRGLCYFAGSALVQMNTANQKAREIYHVEPGWEPGPGLSVGPDGTHATFVERRGATSRLRMVPLGGGAAVTVYEAAFAMNHPIHRPMRAQILYGQGDELWMVDSDGRENRRLEIAPGRVASPNWSPEGHTVLYLNVPEDRAQLRAIRELTPDTNSDKLVAKTSQFACFGFNRDSSVFAGASLNRGAPTVLILLRVARRELTLCEHKASDAATVAPVFSPDSQRLYFQSDRQGKPALYCIHVEKLVERTESETA